MTKATQIFSMYFSRIQRNKAKISYLIPLHWNASSGKRLSSDTSCMRACSVVSDSLWPYSLQPTRVLCPWDFPARRLELVAISSSRRSSQPRDGTPVSCIASRLFTTVLPGKPSSHAQHYCLQSCQQRMGLAVLFQVTLMYGFINFFFRYTVFFFFFNSVFISLTDTGLLAN